MQKNHHHPAGVFIAILNMGLGHATRSLPLITYLLNQGWRVVIGSSGRSLIFLQKEIPGASFVTLPDYNLHYSKSGVNFIQLLSQLPRLLKIIQAEHLLTEKILEEQHLQMVVSDHRYGCYSYRQPSFFISHQLRFAAPSWLKSFEIVGFWFNRYFHKKYRAIIVPDFAHRGEGLLSGRLSRLKKHPNYYFCGILSSISFLESPLDIDILVSISGPEPQRTIFEQKMRHQLPRLPGNKVMVLGKPEVEIVDKKTPGLTIYSHLNRCDLQKYFNRSKLIVSRSGYSTIMELIELRKRALLIPTPGQTEQLLLAKRLKAMGWFHTVSQDKLDLDIDVELAKRYPGSPLLAQTRDSLQKIYEILVTSKN